MKLQVHGNSFEKKAWLLLGTAHEVNAKLETTETKKNLRESKTKIFQPEKIIEMHAS